MSILPPKLSTVESFGGTNTAIIIDILLSFDLIVLGKVAEWSGGGIVYANNERNRRSILRLIPFVLSFFYERSTHPYKVV
jgi:hypothetical protein